MACTSGKGENADGSACIDCVGSNYSQFGTCQPCAAGLFPSKGRISCESVGDMSVTSIDTVETVLSNDPEILPQTTLEFGISIIDGQIPEVGSAEEASVFLRVAQAITDSLGLPLSNIEIIRLSCIGCSTGRRLQESIMAVAFDFVILSANAVEVLGSLIEQLSDPNSSLRTNPALGSLNHEVLPIFEFVCRAGKERPEGSTSCVACPSGKVAPTGSSSCSRCTDPLMVPDAAATT
eukprot:COSAG06_NODE_20485_length_794_cov_0.552518_1_plen_235_part_01